MFLFLILGSMLPPYPLPFSIRDSCPPFWRRPKFWEGLVSFETCPMSLLRFIWNFAPRKDGQSMIDSQEERQTDNGKTKMEREGDMGSGIRGGERNGGGLEPRRGA